MSENLMNLYVVTIDNHDIYGNYTDDEIKEAMLDLYISLKDDIDRNYTIEEQVEYHYDDLVGLYKLMNQEDLKYFDLKRFLTLYNELAPNEYKVERIKIDPSDEALAIRFICQYGLKNYKNNFEFIELHLYQDSKAPSVKQIPKCDLKQYINNFIYEETDKVTHVYNGMDIMDIKFEYLKNLKSRYDDLNNGINELIVLENLIDDYNYEHKETVKKIKISK